ncbi:hypothetical protein EYW49_11545 [Siculibacillus lacustris]|uniref:DUF2550 family protein n=1 Tax=Siculibacillus lacustris TaxID=1549641 RepID=A0A4Q9VNX1_9HYPH|nr:hypothetical protein [Siculibacillus lacustris]TBW37385.1 hypothetical protein EYW49_11545 [Siculibacillus lacustris]
MPIDLREILIDVVAAAIVLLVLRTFFRRRRVSPVEPAVRLTAPPTPVVGARPGIAAAAPGGDWKVLAAHWQAPTGPVDPIATGADLMIGPVRWRNCVRVGADAEALRLEISIPLLGRFGTNPVAIPWGSIGPDEPATLYGGDARRFTVGTPPVATLTLRTALWAAALAHAPGTDERRQD